jgi:undecaprenyl-diphosphatase
MDYFISLILGIIQGITEFLPVSSSGHLIVFRDILNFEFSDSLSFDIALHFGTLIAIIIFFSKDVARLIKAWFSSFKDLKKMNTDQKLAWLIILGTIPAALAGAFLSEMIDNYIRNTLVVIITLIAGGILFLIVEKVYKAKLEMKELNWKSVLTIGIAQAIALIPGVSRSGITIITGMGFKLQRTEAARFSFLLGIPAILGAAIWQAVKLDYSALTGSDWIIFAIGIVSSAIVGFLAIKFLLAILKKYSMRPFAYYRFVLAIVLIIYLILKN